MNQLFEPSSLSGIRVKNRIIRSATHEGIADEEGHPTEVLIALYTRLAKGGVGAIITGEAGVQRNGRSSANVSLMIHRDDFIEDWPSRCIAMTPRSWFSYSIAEGKRTPKRSGEPQSPLPRVCRT